MSHSSSHSGVFSRCANVNLTVEELHRLAVENERARTRNRLVDHGGTIYVRVFVQYIHANGPSGPKLTEEAIQAKVTEILNVSNRDFGDEPDIKVPLDTPLFKGNKENQERAETYHKAAKSPKVKLIMPLPIKYMQVPLSVVSVGGDTNALDRNLKQALAPAYMPEKYMNFWIVDGIARTSLLGYAQFPTRGAPETDGVLYILAPKPYDGHRTLTHEAGHYFSVQHPFQYNVAKRRSDDECSDTPQTADPTLGNPLNGRKWPTNTESFSNQLNYPNFFLFMDYADDCVMRYFSAEECARIRATLFGVRSGIVATEEEVARCAGAPYRVSLSSSSSSSSDESPPTIESKAPSQPVSTKPASLAQELKPLVKPIARVPAAVKEQWMQSICSGLTFCCPH